MKIRAAFFVFAVAVTMTASAHAENPYRFVNKRPVTREHISSNPVVMGAQNTGRGWVNAFCGLNECAKDKWSTRHRTRAMRPSIKPGAPSVGTYIAR